MKSLRFGVDSSGVGEEAAASTVTEIDGAEAECGVQACADARLICVSCMVAAVTGVNPGGSMWKPSIVLRLGRTARIRGFLLPEAAP